MSEVIDWPADLMRISDATYFIQPTTRSAGRGLSGFEQIIGTATAVWTVALTFNLDFDAIRMKRFEAQVSMMRGRLNSARLPICDPFRYGARVSPFQQRYSDTTFHTDATGFSTPGGGVQPMTAAAGAAAGADQLNIVVTDPRRPAFRVGDFFTHQDFLYRVVRRTDAGWTRIEPPLRRAIAAGNTLLTDPPIWRCKFASDDEGRRMRERLKWGSEITLNFVEDPDR